MFQEEEAYDTAPVAEASIDDLDGESYHSAFERIIRQGSKMFTGAETVLREAITNAVMHRDYSPTRQNEAVNVEIYADRVVVTNPGSLLQNQTVENLTTDAKSVPRNPALSRILRHTLLPDYNGPVAESNGSGIPHMQAEMQKRGLKPPVFSDDLNRVTVTLYRSDAQPRFPVKAQAQPQALAVAGAAADKTGGEQSIFEIVSDPETPAAELATEKAAAQKAAGAQLTGAQLAVLSELSATEHRNIHDLAERTAKSPAALGRS